MTQHRILFVCLGNICRSPLAEGAMRQLIVEEDRLDSFLLASAGLSAVHSGEPPDPRAVRAAAEQGIDISAKRAHQIAAEDFKRFDLVLAMDRANRDALLAMAPAGTKQKVHLLLDFSPWIGESEVPDPYYGNDDGFAEVFDIILLAVRGMLGTLDYLDSALVVPAAPRVRLKVSSAT
jgi:protein-tyrosine phosphatase